MLGLLEEHNILFCIILQNCSKESASKIFWPTLKKQITGYEDCLQCHFRLELILGGERMDDAFVTYSGIIIRLCKSNPGFPA